MSARADIMNKLDRVGMAQLPALVDNLLATMLDLRVAPLHAGKIKLSIAGPGRHG